jgi:sialidase-1
MARPEKGEISAFSPNLLRLADGRRLFVYMRYLSFDKARNKYPPSTTVAMTSSDDGRTFTRLATLLEEQPITVCSHSLKQLASGRIVIPLNRDLSTKGQADHWEAGVAYSDDGGRTWKQSDNWVDAPKRGAMEPHVEELARDHLLMVMRTQMGSVYKSESRDGGRTWSRAESLGIEAPESCPELCKVPGTGDLLLIWNGSKYDPSGRRTTASVPRSPAPSPKTAAAPGRPRAISRPTPRERSPTPAPSSRAAERCWSTTGPASTPIGASCRTTPSI